jgi:hypothetical protein
LLQPAFFFSGSDCFTFASISGMGLAAGHEKLMEMALKLRAEKKRNSNG